MATYAPPPGTADIFEPESAEWRLLERTAAEVFSRYGYGELRTPVFEYTEVFQRGLGGGISESGHQPDQELGQVL